MNSRNDKMFDVPDSLTDGLPEDVAAQKERPRATWRRPRLERLRVTMDTALTAGSFSDGVKSTAFPT